MKGVLEETSDQIAVSVHFFAIQAGVRDHNGRHTFDDGVVVGWHVSC